MTIGIAAATEWNGQEVVILCSDDRLGLKVREVGAKWVALMAGQLSKAIDLCECFDAHAETFEGIKNDYELTVALGVPAKQQKRKLIEDYVHSKLGFDYETFLRIGNEQLPDNVYYTVTNEIMNLDLGAELILVGPVGKHMKIYHVDKWGDVANDPSFAAIGSGADLAMALLYAREQTSRLKFPQSLYHVYEAKRFSESAPGVGPKTHILITAMNGKLYGLVNKGKDRLAEMTKTFGPQNTNGVELDAQVTDNLKLLHVQAGQLGGVK